MGLSPQDVAVLRQHQQLARAQARSSAGSQASSQTEFDKIKRIREIVKGFRSRCLTLERRIG